MNIDNLKLSGKMECFETGIIYKNPKPHIHSVQAYFPSVVLLDNGDLLCSIALGEAFEASNLNTHICRSRDQGTTWQLESRIEADVLGRLTSNCARITALPHGELVMFMIRHERTDYAECGLTNPETLGFVPVELLILRSNDYGYHWSLPQRIETSVSGPAFEMCSPIVPIRDGRWLLPTQTWPGWEGDCPEGIKMIALVSHDQGKTWPSHLNVMAGEGKVYFWESKILEFPNGDLLAVAWVYDDDKSEDRPNHFSMSKDGGKTWSTPKSCGLYGQTLTPILLDDNTIFSVYRRIDRSGLWANISFLDKDEWVNVAELPLWGHEKVGLITSSENMSHNFSALKFGAPSLCKLDRDTIFVAFWGYEAETSVIRWFKIKVSGLLPLI